MGIISQILPTTILSLQSRPRLQELYVLRQDPFSLAQGNRGFQAQRGDFRISCSKKGPYRSPTLRPFCCHASQSVCRALQCAPSPVHWDAVMLFPSGSLAFESRYWEPTASHQILVMFGTHVYYL